MPRKKPEELKSKAGTQSAAPAATTTTPAPTPVAPSAPIATPAPAPVTPSTNGFHAADVNGDGVVDDQEKAMYLEFRRKEFEDADAMRDAQRSMAWFALGGMLLYPFAVVLAVFLDLESAGTILGNMAATYFVSVAAIVAAFFGGQAFTQTKKK
jgi:hypothetical protein